MILSLFKKDPSLDAASALYAAAVEQARAPALYADFGAPDTVEGRFELVTLHVYLILRRLKGEDPAVRKVAQKLFDVMFQNMDDSLRELGVGDLSIGKKIRRMAENFYGRVGAYEEALTGDAKDEAKEEAGGGTGEDALAAALGRNIFADEAAPAAGAFAGYVRAAAAFIEDQPAARIAGGVVRFPAAGPVDAGPVDAGSEDAGPVDAGPVNDAAAEKTGDER